MKTDLNKPPSIWKWFIDKCCSRCLVNTTDEANLSNAINANAKIYIQDDLQVSGSMDAHRYASENSSFSYNYFEDTKPVFFRDLRDRDIIWGEHEQLLLQICDVGTFNELLSVQPEFICFPLLDMLKAWIDNKSTFDDKYEIIFTLTNTAIEYVFTLAPDKPYHGGVESFRSFINIECLDSRSRSFLLERLQLDHETLHNDFSHEKTYRSFFTLEEDGTTGKYRLVNVAKRSDPVKLTNLKRLIY